MTTHIKIIIGIAVGVVALGILLFIAQPDAATGGPGVHLAGELATNVLAVDKQQHDFGTISMKNGKVTTVFTLKNNTSNEVILSKLYTSCMCTTAKLLMGNATEGPFGMPGHGRISTFKHSLKPGEEARLEVVFDPNAHGPAGVGTIQRVVTLEGANGKLANVEIKANVTP